MGRWGLGGVVRGSREGLPRPRGFIQTSSQVLWLLSCTDPEMPTERKGKGQGKGCQGREALHRKVIGQGSTLVKQSLSPTRISQGISWWTPS